MTKPPDNSALYRSENGCQAMMAHYDAALQGLGVAYEGHYTDTGLGPVHAIVCGGEAGKSIALWHVQNANATTWVVWSHALAPTRRIYATGGTGRSASSRPEKGDRPMASGRRRCWPALVCNKPT